MRHQSEIKGVLWDLDGVIADTQSYHYEAMRQALATYGYPHSEEIIQRLFGSTTKEIIIATFQGNITPQLIEEIKATHSRLFCDNIAGRVVAFPGVSACLKLFYERGMYQAIASSSTIDIIDRIVDELNIRSFFHALVAGADLPSKPDPAIFNKAAEALGLANEECVVIEDSPMGIESARAAGMRCIALATSRPKEALSAANICLDSLNEITEKTLDRLSN